MCYKFKIIKGKKVKKKQEIKEDFSYLKENKV